MATKKYNIILKNDDVNTIQDIIKMVSTVCSYPVTQAEQIATIANYQGEAIMKESVSESQADMYDKIFEKLGVNVEIKEQ